MAQTKTKRTGRGRAASKSRRASSAPSRPRKSSARTARGKSGSATRSTKSNGRTRSRRKPAGISTVRPFDNNAKGRASRRVSAAMRNGRVRAVTKKAKGVGAGAARSVKGVATVAARQAKGLGVVGLAGLAATAGLAGGIALDRWNNSYSHTQAFAKRRRGRR
jgi:hypothetical protein